MRALNLIFWSMIIPMVTYASELWIMKQADIDKLDEFQRFAGQTVQRFGKYSPNETSFAGLGWICQENFVYAKKLVSLRTLVIMQDESVYKQVLLLRTRQFCNNIEVIVANQHESPVFDMLRVALMYGIFEEVINMVIKKHYFSKNDWKKLVWPRPWIIEDEDWSFRTEFFSSDRYAEIYDLVGTVRQLPNSIRECEVMAKVVCGASKLKCHDPPLKRAKFNLRKCTLCDEFAREDIERLVIGCTWHKKIQEEIFRELENINQLY